MASDTPDRWTFTPAEVAERMGVSAQTNREQCREGHIRSVQFGKLYLIPRSEVQRLLGEPYGRTTRTSYHPRQGRNK